MDKVSINDIAKKAGVSAATVSNVLNRKKNVGEETRKTVMKIVEEMGYEHRGKGSLENVGGNKTILVNFSDFDTLFYLDILHGISDYIQRHGYRLLICTGADLEHYADSDKVCGCIVLDSHTDDETVFEMADRGLPVITLDRELPHHNIKSMIVSNYEGERQLVEKLIESGARSFAYLKGLDTVDCRERYRAFRDVLKEHDIHIKRNDIYEGDWREKSGSQTARLIMLLDRMPDVLICANDMMAIGAIRKFQENGIRIPDDIYVAGFDDIIIARYLGLTTVSVPDYERGFLAAQALINIVTGHGDYETFHIGARVKWRRSTGAAKK